MDSSIMGSDVLSYEMWYAIYEMITLSDNVKMCFVIRKICMSDDEITYRVMSDKLDVLSDERLRV